VRAERRCRSASGATAVSFRERITRTVAVLLLSSAVACSGGGGHPTTHQSSPPTTTSPPTSSTAPISTIATTTNVPMFQATLRSDQGDTASLRGVLRDPPRPSGSSDVPPGALASCVDQPSRALVAKVVLDLTLTSKLSLDEVTMMLGANGKFPLQPKAVIQYSSGAQCAQSVTDGNISMKSVEPQQLRSITVWVVVPDAVTPAQPAGDPAMLTTVRLGVTVLLGTSGATKYTTGSGPYVSACSSSNANSTNDLEISLVVPQKPASCQ
jgi:hypothetical protein